MSRSWWKVPKEFGLIKAIQLIHFRVVCSQFYYVHLWLIERIQSIYNLVAKSWYFQPELIFSRREVTPTIFEKSNKYN